MKMKKIICPRCGAEIEEQWHGFECSCGYFQRSEDKSYSGYVPSGCRACGGPYPQCKSSCNLFDD